ncbi:MAG TPA: DUF4129 domain-containing protein [Candidatus Aquilonibacter sp.]|nr:DUF4129 domain-containing protein [Candidatus Aquilonibacter sp.]
MKRSACASFLLAILAILAPGRSVRAQNQSSAPLTLRQYIAELDSCSAVLNTHQSDPAAFRNLRATLPAEWKVTEGGQTYAVSTDWLTGALVALRVDTPGKNPLLAQTRQHLGALRAAAADLEDQSSSQNLQQTRAQLDHILSAKEFQGGGSGPSWFDVLKARFYDWLDRLIDRLFGHFRHGRTIGNAIAWTVIALAAVLLALWAARSSLRGTNQPGIDLEGAARPEGGWRDWLRNAGAAAQRGDYRAAIHGAYWAAVMRLEDVHQLPQDRARTPREALRLIRRESAEYAPLAQLTRRFELVWYGYRSATETDWTDAMEQLEKLGCLPSSTPAIAVS